MPPDQPLAHWDFYMALAYFKLAIIAAGIAVPRRGRAASGADTDKVGEAVAPLITAGLVRTWS